VRLTLPRPRRTGVLLGVAVARPGGPRGYRPRPKGKAMHTTCREGYPPRAPAASHRPWGVGAAALVPPENAVGQHRGRGLLRRRRQRPRRRRRRWVRRRRGPRARSQHPRTPGTHDAEGGLPPQGDASTSLAPLNFGSAAESTASMFPIFSSRRQPRRRDLAALARLRSTSGSHVLYLLPVTAAGTSHGNPGHARAITGQRGAPGAPTK